MLIVRPNCYATYSGRLEKDLDRKTETLATLTEKFKTTEAKVLLSKFVGLFSVPLVGWYGCSIHGQFRHLFSLSG